MNEEETDSRSSFYNYVTEVLNEENKEEDEEYDQVGIKISALFLFIC